MQQSSQRMVINNEWRNQLVNFTICRWPIFIYMSNSSHTSQRTRAQNDTKQNSECRKDRKIAFVATADTCTVSTEHQRIIINLMSLYFAVLLLMLLLLYIAHIMLMTKQERQEKKIVQNWTMRWRRSRKCVENEKKKQYVSTPKLSKLLPDNEFVL